ncbi:olfactory receptor 5V1-like [Rhinatrema bivittatum]|uniref:olfactory receptor 5V1-like n=1 Tax=Rhinatrema bivittatum TaxID=194408 RepID=UPI00112DF599|nr:olfactory receptor 5V1-like [Rhinatrema bivittatum]
MEDLNGTTISEIIVLGFSDLRDFQPELFVIFLIFYLVSLLGNLLITAIIILEPRLHTPMYFFLSNLSALDILCSSSAIPKMLHNLLTKKNTISFSGCMVQLYLFTSFLGTELSLLAVMSYDRYVAICQPMRYPLIMNKRVCACLAAVVWFIGTFNSVLLTALMFRLSFCGPNVIKHFFCEIPPILKLSCSDTSVNDFATLIADLLLGITCFLLTLVSYICIISSIVKIRSNAKKKKAFSTCASHLSVVAVFYGTVIYTYVRPILPHSMDDDKIVSVMYTIVSPLLNPLIYSLRNKEVIQAFTKLWKKVFLQKT